MVVGISMVKDEADVVGTTVSHMAEQVDHVIVADNGSTDGTREILDGLGVEVLVDPDPAYYQSRKMSALAARAREAGAGWVVPFDADELWLAREGRICDELRALPDCVLVAQAVLYDHVATDRDPVGEPLTSMGWRQLHPKPFRKVACRARPGLVIHQGNHSAEYEGTRTPPTAADLFEVRHFPIRSPEQWVRKARNGAAAYAATDLPESMGQHWRDWGKFIERHGEEALAAAFYEHHWSGDPESDPTLIFDPAP
jgi:glycosyltransferase involved in cell wall biosynthesis